MPIQTGEFGSEQSDKLGTIRLLNNYHINLCPNAAPSICGFARWFDRGIADTIPTIHPTRQGDSDFLAPRDLLVNHHSISHNGSLGGGVFPTEGAYP